jgi:hypothetical protein
VAQLTACSADAEMQLSVDHQSAADAGADGKDSYCIHTAASAETPFSIGY